MPFLVRRARSLHQRRREPKDRGCVHALMYPRCRFIQPLVPRVQILAQDSQQEALFLIKRCKVHYDGGRVQPVWFNYFH